MIIKAKYSSPKLTKNHFVPALGGHFDRFFHKISDLSLISFPIEKTSLLSRRLPKREHGIEYLLNGKKHYIKFSMQSSGKCIYDICQYDATRFLMSIKGNIDEIKYGKSQHYVV